MMPSFSLVFSFPYKLFTVTMRAFSALSVFIAIGAVSAVPALTSVNSTTTASSTTDKAYIPVVWNKTAIIPSFGPIHGLPIQARDGDFWVGGNASALCPVCSRKQRIHCEL